MSADDILVRYLRDQLANARRDRDRLRATLARVEEFKREAQALSQGGYYQQAGEWAARKLRDALDGEAGKPVDHRSLRDRFPESFKDYQTPSWIEEAEDSDEPLKVFSPWDCPDGPHRGPEGPNEDLGQCAKCWSLSHVLRPEGETFGHHLSDCSLPIRHRGECISGGTGHPAAPKVRGPRALDGEGQS